MARRFTISEIAWFSARSDFRNLRRAGVAEKRSRTSTRVPGLRPAGFKECLVPRSTTISKPSAAPRARDGSQRRAIEPMEGSASPRKPSVRMPRDRRRASFEVAWRSTAEREVVRLHAGAVVGDADQRQAAGRCHDLDLARAGVDGVLDELLDDARRPLDHLARGDAVDGLGAQLANRHVARPLSAERSEADAATSSKRKTTQPIVSSWPRRRPSTSPLPRSIRW